MDRLINNTIKNYILRETFENEDYPLYHRCGLNKLYNILKYNSLESRNWDGEACISCTRNKSYVVPNTSSKYANITFNIGKLKAHNRFIYIKNFSWKKKSEYGYEYEERICNKKGSLVSFTITDIDECIDRIDLVITFDDYNRREEEWNEILDLIKYSKLYQKIFFTTNKYEWDKGITRNSHHISQFDVIEKGISRELHDIYKGEDTRKNNIKYLESLYDNEDLKVQLKNTSFEELSNMFDGVDNTNYENIFYVSKYEGYNHKYNFLDFNEYRLLLPFWVDTLTDFDDNGYARFYYNGKCNEVNFKGELLWNDIFDNWFDDISKNGREGFYRVELDGLYNLVNLNGKLLMNEWYEWCTLFKNGYARITNSHNKMNYVDIHGKILSKDLWFDDVYTFKGDFAEVELNGLCNFINKDGKLLSPNQWFDEAMNSFEQMGYGMVRLQGHDYKIDENGNLSKINGE